MGVPAVVINLDRSTDRLAHVQGEFTRVGMSFERFQAVTGVDLPEGVRHYFCDASGNVVSPLRPGEIGCYASHLAVWQQIAVSASPVLVCEDDISLPAGFAALLDTTLAVAPTGWDFIRLSSPTRRPVVPISDLGAGYRLVRYWREPTLSGATLVSPQGARKMLRPGLRTYPIDADLRRPWAFGIKTFGVWPPPVSQDGHPSIIMASGKRHPYRKLLTPDIWHRHIHSLKALGLREWLRCVAEASVKRKLRPAG